MLQTYRPSNRAPWHGLFFLVLASVLGGLVFGGIAFIVSQIAWIIILFPIGVGLAGGVILSKIIIGHNVRSPMLSAGAALVMGLVIYATFHYGSYISFQSDIRNLMAAEAEGIPLDEQTIDQTIDLILAQETGYTGFFGYLKLEAQTGVSIGRFSSAQALTLNEPLTWLYWLIEVGLITAMTTIVAVEAAKKPFCELCGSWYRGGEHMGSVAASDAPQFMESMRSGNLRHAGQLLGDHNAGTSGLDIYVQRCSRDHEHASVLAVRSSRLDAKGNLQHKDVLEGMIMPHDMINLRHAEAVI